MTPWSVRASAGIPSSAARPTMASIRLAPSRSENSVWLWRWTKLSGACGITLAGVAGSPTGILPLPPRAEGLGWGPNGCCGPHPDPLLADQPDHVTLGVGEQREAAASGEL